MVWGDFLGLFAFCSLYGDALSYFAGLSEDYADSCPVLNAVPDASSVLHNHELHDARVLELHNHTVY